MNQKLSGAQLVLVPITKMGENKFPWIENIRSRFIKFIDFYGATYLPGTAEQGLTTTDSLYITITNGSGNTQLHRNLPLERLDYRKTLGVRQPIYSNICLSDCSVNCQNAAAVGTVAAFVFWYDLPEYSAKNSTNQLVTDSVSVELTTSIRYNKLPDAERMTGKRFRRILTCAPAITPDFYEVNTLASSRISLLIFVGSSLFALVLIEALSASSSIINIGRSIFFVMGSAFSVVSHFVSF